MTLPNNVMGPNRKMLRGSQQQTPYARGGTGPLLVSLRECIPEDCSIADMLPEKTRAQQAIEMKCPHQARARRAQRRERPPRPGPAGRRAPPARRAARSRGT